MFFIGSFVPSLLADRIGRRRPMMWGSFGLGISMMMIAILLSFKGSAVEQSTSSASVTFFFTVSISTFRQYFLSGCTQILWTWIQKKKKKLMIHAAVHAYLRRICQLYTLGIRPRDPPPARTRKGNRSWNLLQLAMGTSLHKTLSLPYR